MKEIEDLKEKELENEIPQELMEENLDSPVTYSNEEIGSDSIVFGGDEWQRAVDQEDLELDFEDDSDLDNIFEDGRTGYMAKALKSKDFKSESEDFLWEIPESIMAEGFKLLPKIFTEFLSLVIENKTGSINLLHHLGLFQSKYLKESEKYKEDHSAKREIEFLPKEEYNDFYRLIENFSETVQTHNLILEIKKMLNSFDYRRF